MTLAYLMLMALVHPSNNRDWSLDAAHLATAEISGNSIRIHNVRNAKYRSTTDYDVHWEERSYDLNKLESVWLVV